MEITKKLLSLDPALTMFAEGSWNDSSVKAAPGEFSSFNDAGIECETGEFLYSLVRLLKPKNVLETGTHWGIGASYMGMALKENGIGHLDTIEFLPDIHYRALQRIAQMGLTEQVTCHFGDAGTFDPHYDADEHSKGVSAGKYGLILLDTEPQTRFSELLKFYPYLGDGGFIFIHDLHRHMHQIPNEEHGFAWPFGLVPDEMRELVRSGKLRPFHFSTPRGLTGFYKVSADDFNWSVDRGMYVDRKYEQGS